MKRINFNVVVQSWPEFRTFKKILETQELYVDVYLKGRLMLFHFIQEDLQVILSVENQFIKILTCLNLEMMLEFS